MAASELNGLTQIPAIVRELTNDQDTIITADSNIQRENILPSERGFAYKMKLETMSRQGKRTDLTCTQVGYKLEKIKNPLNYLPNMLEKAETKFKDIYVYLIEYRYPSKQKEHLES